jgi:hypothetical protein
MGIGPTATMLDNGRGRRDADRVAFAAPRLVMAERDRRRDFCTGTWVREIASVWFSECLYDSEALDLAFPLMSLWGGKEDEL